MKIIPWSPGYYPDIADAGKRRQQCYAEIVSNIEQGTYVDVGANTAYLFYYIHTLQSALCDAFQSQALAELEQRYRNFISLYAESAPKPVSYLDTWLPILAYLQHKPAADVATEIERCSAYRAEHNLPRCLIPLMPLLMHCQQITASTKVDARFFLPFSPINPKINLSNTSKARFDEILPFIHQILDADYDRTHVNFLYKMYDFTNGHLEIRNDYFTFHEEKSSSPAAKTHTTPSQSVRPTPDTPPSQPTISIAGTDPYKYISISNLLVPVRQPVAPEQKKFITTVIKEASRLSRKKSNQNQKSGQHPTTADLYAISDRLSQIISSEHSDQ